MARELSTSALITGEFPVVRPGSNCSFFSLPLRWRANEELPECTTKPEKGWLDDDKRKASLCSQSSSPKIIIILLLLAPAALCFFTVSLRWLGTGKRERLAPPSKPQPGEKVLNPPSTWIVSSSPLWGSSELLKDKVQTKSAVSPPDAKLLNADHEPALSVCLSVSYRLSICNKCHSIITFLRICTDRQQPWIHH